MLVLFGAYFCISTLIFQLIYSFQPSVFIDEQFHIPQAQKYCNGSFFEWDDKITTLPGLYLISVLFLTPLKLLNISCTIWWLRYLNLVINFFNIFLITEILKKLEKDTKPQTFTSITIAAFPLLYFFSFFYYTDPGSVTSVLAMYLSSLHQRNHLSGLFAVISIMFRQNNVSWVGFVAGIKVAHQIDTMSGIQDIKIGSNVNNRAIRFLSSFLIFIVRYLLVLDNLRKMILSIIHHIIVIIFFFIFVFMNGGIVVGDRSSHQVVLHLSQLLYCSIFILFFSSFHLITKDKLQRCLRLISKHPTIFIFFIFASVITLTKHSFVHPYLLADNRHLVFYIWRRFLGHPILRFLFIPIYFYAFWSINDSLSQNGRSILWRLIYLLCSAAVIVPQSLLEFRYFILPYLLFRLNVKTTKRYLIFYEFLFYSFINFTTIYIFITKTFAWQDYPEPQRIIW